MTWMLIRASGFVALGTLSGATIWGLVVASGLLGRSVSAKQLTYVHESLSVSAILATAVHMIALYADEFIEFGPRELFIPGESIWQPVPVAMGILAMYGLVLVTASFYVRKWIGQKAWRSLHYVTFGVFTAAMAHGIIVGTDSGSMAAVVFYASLITAVVGLVMLRAVRLNEPEKRSGRAAQRPPARGAAASPSERA